MKTYENMTIEQLKAHLDAKGEGGLSKLKKQELIDIAVDIDLNESGKVQKPVVADTADDFVVAVKAHGYAHYDKGWDIVIETWTDKEIAKAIGRARTTMGAIRKVWLEVKPLVDHRKEIQAA